MDTASPGKRPSRRACFRWHVRRCLAWVGCRHSEGHLSAKFNSTERQALQGSIGLMAVATGNLDALIARAP